MSQSRERCAAAPRGPASRRARRRANARPARWRGYGQPASSSAFACSGSLPCVVVGSGLPPSAHTSRSIISFRLAGAWYQCTGVHDEHAVRRHPARIDLGHPVVGLAHGVVRDSSCTASGTAASPSRRRPCTDGSPSRARRRGARARAGRPRSPAALRSSCARGRRGASVLDISPGQVCSLRVAPLTIKIRDL